MISCLTEWLVTTSRRSVPLTTARWWARATASAPEWSQETVALISAIITVAPRLITARSSLRTSAALDPSMWSGSTTTARWPAHSTG